VNSLSLSPFVLDYLWSFFYIIILGYPSAREEVFSLFLSSEKCHITTSITVAQSHAHHIIHSHLLHQMRSATTNLLFPSCTRTASRVRIRDISPRTRRGVPLTALSGSCLRGGRLGLPHLLADGLGWPDHDGNGCGYTAKANM
jgi:hypothetical protein